MKVIEGMKFYDRRDLAELLGVSTATIMIKQRSGLIPSIRLGKTIYTSEESLRKFLNGETSAQDK